MPEEKGSDLSMDPDVLARVNRAADAATAREEGDMSADETPTVPPDEDPAQPEPQQPDPTAPGVGDEPDRIVRRDDGDGLGADDNGDEEEDRPAAS